MEGIQKVGLFLQFLGLAIAIIVLVGKQIYGEVTINTLFSGFTFVGLICVGIGSFIEKLTAFVKLK